MGLFHQSFIQVIIDNFSYEIRQTKSSLSRLNDHRILSIEKTSQAQKLLAIEEKEALETHIKNLEAQILLNNRKQQLKPQKRTISSQTLPEETHLPNKETKETPLPIKEAPLKKDSLPKESSPPSKEPDPHLFPAYSPEGHLIQITNRALTLTLEKSSEEASRLQSKVIRLKEYKQAFQNVLQLQCKTCCKQVSPSQFLDHCRKGPSCLQEKEIVNIYTTLQSEESRSLDFSKILRYNQVKKEESDLLNEEVLSPLQENGQSLAEERNNKKKGENLEELIERLNRNDKYSILYAKKKEMMYPNQTLAKKDLLNQPLDKRSLFLSKENPKKELIKDAFLKKEPKNEPFKDFFMKKENSSIGLNKEEGFGTLKDFAFVNNKTFDNTKDLGGYKSTLKKEQRKKGLVLWENTENHNPMSQRYDNLGFLFKSMRNCDYVNRKKEETGFFDKNWN